ncbi:MAG: PepSY domain-containing protein [Fimbriimonadaceae bacterium]|nr:PepSY domain-containing protein [Fimbriimonadaceae bacterium]
MYHGSRIWHRRLGAIAAVFLVLIAGTGFLLANKARFSWMRPPEAKGGAFERLTEVVSLDQAARAAFALGHPELQTHRDIDRIDYRPKRNIFKVISKTGYREVQVDGKTGEVLSSSYRTDQLTEHVHDLSFFGDAFHGWVLPGVALVLFFLGLSGTYMYFVPVWRRAAFRRKRARS